MKRCNKHRHQSGKFTSLWPSAHNVPRQHATAVSQVPSSRFPICAVGPQSLVINPLPQSLSACAPHPLDPQAILSGQLTKGSIDGENVTAFAQAKCNSPGPAFHCEHGPTTSDYHFKRPDCLLRRIPIIHAADFHSTQRRSTDGGTSCAAGPPSAAAHAMREPPRARTVRRVGRYRDEADQSRDHRCRHARRAEHNPLPLGGHASSRAPRPSAAESPGRPQGSRTISDGTDIIASIINVRASGSRSVSGRNRTTACTTASARSQTGASGRTPRGPLHPLLSVSQRLTASHGGSVQAPASRKEPRRERGACRKRGRGERGSGEIHNRGDRK